MKLIVLKNGMLGLIPMTLIFGIQWTFLIQGDNVDFGGQEVVGYVGIFLSLAFVYFGIRQFRDSINGGYLSFWEGLKIGLLISLIPSVAFGLANLVYVFVVDPGFMDRYYGSILAELKATLPAAEYELKLREMEAEKAMFMNPFLQFIVMGLTVFLIGVLVSVVSSLFLQKRKPEAAV